MSKTDWHSLQNVTIDFANPVQADSVEQFGWDDTMFYSLGAEFALSDSFTLRAGVARDETPTNDDDRTPRLPDANRDWFSIGLTWMASEALEVNAGYTRHPGRRSVDQRSVRTAAARTWSASTTPTSTCSAFRRSTASDSRTSPVAANEGAPLAPLLLVRAMPALPRRRRRRPFAAGHAVSPSG